MKKFHLVIYTPKGTYFDGQVDEVYLNTSLGYQGILADHDSLITAIDYGPGFIKIDDKKKYYAIFMGVLFIEKGIVKLVLNNIESADSIDLNRAKESQKRALERINNKEEGTDLKRAELALKRAITRINTVNKL